MPVNNSAKDKLSRVGVLIPELYVPSHEVDLQRWATLACDQHTSNLDYWQRVEDYVADHPSTLHCIVPEAYLESQDISTRVSRAHEAMRQYLDDGTLFSPGEGFMLVRRTLSDGSVRNGILVALDLEHYDYNSGATTLIRATEKTIVERIPARMMIRDGAPLEFPHVLVMVDDPEETLIEPIARSAEQLEQVYHTNLMFDGGAVEGRFISDQRHVDAMAQAFSTLADPQRFHKKYGSDTPVLFPVGDGNHSLAAAKRYWEERKASGAGENDAARYALVELVNLRGAGLPFMPIHRTIAGPAPQEIVRGLHEAGFSASDGRHMPSAEDTFLSGVQVRMHTQEGATLFTGDHQDSLAVAKVDDMIEQLPSPRVDYVHGFEAIRSAVSRGETAIELPTLERDMLLPTVLRRGALPRKAFSLGRSEDKRYYLEARRLR